ncbi:MAG: DegV family protein [Nevskia sp.]|nr:DegV family protein [Nevskia sp.]
MRIGLVVDSACDLPPDFYRDNRLVILPITIRIGKQQFVDQRDPQATLDFYHQHLSNAAQGETEAFSVEQIKQLFLEKLVVDYDFVLTLILASSRSPMFEHATQASLSILSEYKPIRAKAGLNTPFALRVVDTQNLFAGQGVLAVEAVRMIKSGAPPNRIRERLEALIPNLYAYMLPNNLGHLRTRAAKKGDRSVGWFKYAVASTLDIKPLLRAYRNDTRPVANLRHYGEGAQHCFEFIIRKINQGLLTPTLCLSYSGELANLEKMLGYRKMREVAEKAGVEVFVSLMSITGAVNVGEGSLVFAFCAEPHEFE